MPLGSMGGKSTQDTPPSVKHKKKVVTFEEINISSGGGYTFGFCGEANSGKTITALTFGYLNKTFLPLWEKHFPLTAKALEEGVIPEVQRIEVIDSENALEKQLPRPFEQKFLKPLMGKVPIQRHRIEPVAPKVYDDIENGFEITQDSVSLVFDALDQYEDALRLSRDNHCLLVLDSASRLYKLLTAKSKIIYQQRVKDKGEETVKNEGFAKWQDRNVWWDEDMTLLRGVVS